jgi:hypothetical protein
VEVVPQLVEAAELDGTVTVVSCGSRHTVALTRSSSKSNQAYLNPTKLKKSKNRKKSDLNRTNLISNQTNRSNQTIEQMES